MSFISGMGMNSVAVHRRGGVCPPEYIHDYTIRNVIGRADPAPTGLIQNHPRNEQHLLDTLQRTVFLFCIETGTGFVNVGAELVMSFYGSIRV